MTQHEIAVIDFQAPYSDLAAEEAIVEHTIATLQNEIPVFQVDVGDDRHLAGTLAVRNVIECTVNMELGDSLQKHGYLPFRFTGQAMRTPHYISSSHARVRSLAPHVDNGQLALALHKEYVGEVTPVQFGHSRKDAVLPEILENGAYTGPGLEPFVDHLYSGVTQLGRLTIFSQGFEPAGIAPAAHFFDRVPDQVVGGRWTRYYALDAAMRDQVRAPYDQFVTMRKNASLYLDHCQWVELGYDLERVDENFDMTRRAELEMYVKSHITDHPGARYSYWEIRQNQDMELPFSYGVLGGEYTLDTITEFAARPK